jgi:spore coat polysaccharide biosynthesis predicted glycosyltransferase SpsG
VSHLAIRADGGPEIGYGHLVRSGALAEELLARGHDVTVATATPQSAGEVFPDAAAVVDLPARDDPAPFVSWIESAEPDIAYTDAYPIDTAYQQAVRERVPLAVWQDDARHAVCADLFVNGNLYAPDLDYEFVGDPPETCLGTEYVLLRQQIRDLLPEDPPWRDPPEWAIVTMGASDTEELTPTVVRAFDGLNLQVDAIVGPGCSDQQERTTRDVATTVSAEVRVVRDPDDLPERMFQADIAVSTASSTTYELLALGTPLVTVPVADNQEPIATALRERDAAAVLNRGTDYEALREAIEMYQSDSTVRGNRSKRGRELVDGGGVERVGAELISIGPENCRT